MDYIGLSLIMLLAQFSPGPDMLLLLRNALQHPARTGLCTVLGIACGLSVHLAIVLTGLGLAIKNSRILYPVLLIAGACWLGNLGVSLLKSAWKMSAAAGEAETGAAASLPPRTAFLQGLITNLSNIKAIIFLGTIVLAWLGNQPSLGRKLGCFAIIIGQALVFWSLFVLALQHPGVRRTWNRIQRPLTGLFGLSLVLLAVDAARQGGLLLRQL